MDTSQHNPPPSQSAVLATLAIVGGLTIVAGMLPAASIAARPVGINGPSDCTAFAVNRDPAQAAVAVFDFYRQGGAAPPISLAVPPIAAGSHVAIDLGSESSLASGAYAAIVSSDRAIAVGSRCIWPTSGGAIEDVAGWASTELWAPFALANGERTGWLYSIQNTDTSQTARMTLDVNGPGAMPVLSQNYSVGPGTAFTIDTLNNPSFLAIPPMTGTLRVTSAIPLVAETIVDASDDDRAVAGAPMQPVENAADTLLLPRVRRGSGAGAADGTRVWVINPGMAPVEAMLTIVGSGGACRSQTFAVGPISVGAAGAAVIDLAAAASGIPEGCEGSATLSAIGGNVLATAFERDANGGRRDSGGYNALPEADAALSAYAVRWGPSSVVDLFNPGTSSAAIALQVIAGDGQEAVCHAGCALTLAAGAAVSVPATAVDTTLTPGATGSLRVVSDVPLAGVVAEGGPGTPYDLTLSPLHPLEGGSPSESRGHLAFLGKSGLAQATPTVAMATATPALTATATTAPTATAPVTVTATVPVPTATPRGRVTSTVAPMPSDTPTAAPTPTPTPLAAGGPQLGPSLTGRVPAAAIAAALADPSSVWGWNVPCNPNVPVGPHNPLRRTLRLQNPNVPYHPLFNGLVFACG